MTEQELIDMLTLHKQYYYEDLKDIDSEKSALYAERIIKSIGISMKANLGRDFYTAYGIIDDHVSELISATTAVRRLFKLKNSL